MGGKDSRSFSIDHDLNERLKSRTDMNASSVVNSLLRDYLDAGRAPDVALQKRLDSTEEELTELRVKIERLESRAERLERERDRIQQQMDERRKEGTEEIQQVVEDIHEGLFKREYLEPDNPAVQNYAAKAQMTPERFIQEVEDRL